VGYWRVSVSNSLLKRYSNFILQFQPRFSVHSVQVRAFEPGVISRALRLKQDLNVGEVWQRAGGRTLRVRRSEREVRSMEAQCLERDFWTGITSG
jgi:hypothetical protein